MVENNYFRKLIDANKDTIKNLNDKNALLELEKKAIEKELQHKEIQIDKLQDMIDQKDEQIKELQNDIDKMSPDIDFLLQAIDVLQSNTNTKAIEFNQKIILEDDKELIFGLNIDTLLFKKANLEELKTYLYLMDCHCHINYKLTNFTPNNKADMILFGSTLSSFIIDNANVYDELRGILQLVAPDLINTYITLRYYGNIDISNTINDFIKQIKENQI